MTGQDCTAALSFTVDGVYLNVHAQPGARREAICGMHGDALKIAVRPAAEAGRANAAIVALLADGLGVRRGDIEMIAGHGSRRKRLLVRADADQVADRLTELLRGA